MYYSIKTLIILVAHYLNKIRQGLHFNLIAGTHTSKLLTKMFTKKFIIKASFVKPE
jgi:hypothetical protein